MAHSKYQSTMDTTYFAREARVILGPCTDILCDILTHKITPSDLSKEVKRRTKNCPKGKKNLFTKDQLQLIHGENYSKFDITLLYSLLRNICQITPHVNGWGNDPCPADRNVSANIERIRLKRNEYGHSSKPYITEKEFKKTFQEISQITRELEHYLGTTSKYHDAVQEIETCIMDPKESEKYIEKLLNINEKLHDISEEVRQIKEIKTAAVPSNLKELYMIDISKWEKEDSYFVETHSFPTMFEQVKNQPYVTFVGAPGSGKSATAHHIALKLQNEDGYDILPIRDIKDIETYCDLHNLQVFVIDDVLGVFGFDMNKFNLLQTYKDRFTLAAKSKTKILMTCRAIVFKNETLSKYFLTEETKVIQLHSKHNKLTDEDKRSLLQMYKWNRSLIPPGKMSETSAMFPYLCKMFSEQEFNVHGYRFFITPIKYIKVALDKMQTRNKMHYVSLVLLMLHQNKLSDTDLEREHTESKPIDIKDVFRKCKVNSHTDSFKITDAIKEMDGTYTQTCDDQFCFIHDSMFEIVACQFGRQFPELILKYMSSEYIANYIKEGTNNGEINENESDEMLENIEDLSITLHESKLPMFAERLFIDLKDGEFIGIFKNLKHPSIMQAFQTLIKEKQYDELYTAFLSNKKTIRSLIRFILFKSRHEYRNVFDLLIGGLINKDEHNNFVRAIWCFVLRGQHGILQHIIDQMMLQNGNVNDLFQTFCNEKQQCGQGMNEDDTGAEVERTENDNTTVETTTNKIKIPEKSTLCFKNAADKEILNNDHTRADYKDSESNSKSDINRYSEKMIFEQWRLLCLGCHSGDVNTVKILLKYISKDALNMHIKDHAFTDKNPLTVAYTYGYFNIAKELIRAGANVNPQIDNKYEQSHLSKCCSSGKGHWDIAKELIKAGADVNIGYAFGTPLIHACKKNNLSAVRLLIKAGANLNLKAENKTPLQISYDAKNLRIADVLIKAGANANSANGVQSSTRTSCNEKSEKFEKRNNADIDIYPNHKKTKYKTPLIIACENRYYYKVRLLIEEGAEIHKDDGHRTPLDVACQNRDLKILNMFIKAGADVQDSKKFMALVNLKMKNGIPFVTEFKQFNASVYEVLIKKGDDVNLEAGGENPLTAGLPFERYFSPFHDRTYRTKSLIQAGADLNLKIGDKTPLIIACREGYTDNLEVLIKAGADVNLEAGDQTPLIIVCQKERTDMVEVLIKAGADVNLDAGDQTPLTAVLNSYEHETYFEEYPENKLDVVKVLLQAGADFNQVAGDKTPLLVACQKGYTDVVDEFIKAEAGFNLTAQDETKLEVACQERYTNVKEGVGETVTDIHLELQYQSQLLTACLRKQLTIADLIKTDGDSITCKGDNNASLTSKCLIKHLGMIKSWVNSKPKNIISFLMKTACQIGHFNLVKELIEVGVDINLIDGNETPLIIACRRGHATVIKELIKAGVNVNMGAGCNYPLTVACKKMQIGVVKELIEAGADVKLEGSNKSPLTVVCKLYDICLVCRTFDIKLQMSIMEALIKAGSDVDMKAGDETPLIIVCKKGNIDAVQLLLKSGADVNLAAGGVTPLTAACRECHLNVVEELIHAGANVNQKDTHKTPLKTAISTSMIEIIDFVIKAGADVNLKDKDHTPLTLACQEGNLRTVAALIDAGADVNLKVWHKRPLTVACTEGHFDVVKYLIQKEACVDLDDGNKTPLNIAYERKFMRIAEYLVNHGASINLIKDAFAPITVACQMGRINDVRKKIKAGAELNPTNVDKTPLTAACQKGHLSLVKELINAGASVDLMDRFSTPLTTACLWGHLSVVKELIIAGASVDKIDKYNTPLTTACHWGHLDIVKELIRAGSNVNLRDVSNTPLTTACYWGELDIVKDLIESDADVNLQDEENTPLTIACLNNRIDIVKELIKAKANVNGEAGGNTPLTAACEEGDLCIVEMLIEVGADVNLGVEIETTDTDKDIDEY